MPTSKRSRTHAVLTASALAAALLVAPGCRTLAIKAATKAAKEVVRQVRDANDKPRVVSANAQPS